MRISRIDRYDYKRHSTVEQRARALRRHSKLPHRPAVFRGPRALPMCGASVIANSFSNREMVRRHFPDPPNGRNRCWRAGAIVLTHKIDVEPHAGSRLSVLQDLAQAYRHFFDVLILHLLGELRAALIITCA